MSSVTGSSKSTWEPIASVDTTIRSYWINWRFLLCAIWLLLTAIISLLLIWKYDIQRKPVRNTNNIEANKETAHTLYEDETWRPCLKGIHPVWLLAFRVFAFIVLSVLLILILISEGGNLLYFYTQWTFVLVIIYFGLGTLFSMYGCYLHHKKSSGDKIDNVDGDADKRTGDAHSVPQSYNPSNHEKGLRNPEEHLVHKSAGICGYIFQIIFQINAGAVFLTDCVFWFLFVPFLVRNDYNLDFLNISMHTFNIVFMLGDTALNSLKFPWFRIGYFCMWTFTYVIFQWIVHAFVKLWWPYPFLELSNQYAPLWYLLVALLHIPCYGIFALITKLKHTVLSKRYPDSYQCVT
ncbi:hypothetical protein Lalb_Chr07g0182791 [Lupinus albus]|uniref:Transmembrane protein n=1 Tax=Lupinus albus TaxID=3870 RepID=A0A6A4Q852_LUPAL|nr:hypothetical protein Lalb_Chr07g0182791 [Lupinus albus]